MASNEVLSFPDRFASRWISDNTRQVLKWAFGNFNDTSIAPEQGFKLGK